MRITVHATNGIPMTFDRGNSPEERAAASKIIKEVVRPRYTPESKKRARDWARQHRL